MGRLTRSFRHPVGVASRSEPPIACVKPLFACDLPLTPQSAPTPLCAQIAAESAQSAAEAGERRLDAALIADALDPVAALATRVVPGGAAPRPLDAMLAECRDALAAAARWIDESRRRIETAEAALVELAQSRAPSA